MQQFPRTILPILVVGLALPVFSQDAGHIDKEAVEKVFPKRPYSPYAGRNYPTRPFFGDTHLHTSYSMDGGAAGARLGPKEAYRFAKGEEITASSGQQAKLRGLSIFWLLPIIRTVSAFSRCCFRAIPRRSPIRKPGSGTT